MFSIAALLKFILDHKKLFAYIAVVVFEFGVYGTGYFHGRHVEKMAYYKAEQKQETKQEKQNEKDAVKAVANEAKRAAEDTQLESSKEQVKNKINELAKDNPCGNTKLSDDERLYLNDLINKTK